MAQDPTNANANAITAENPSAPTTSSLEAAAPDELIDDDNVDNYDGIGVARSDIALLKNKSRRSSPAGKPISETVVKA